MTGRKRIMIRILPGFALLMAVGIIIPPGRTEALALASTAAVDPTAWNLQETPGSAARDSSDVLGEARSVQARFERQRRHFLPWADGGGGGPCEERVGRFCMWHSGDDGWQPVADTPEMVALREGLLAGLAELAVEIPGDTWILGQRVFYLAEAGRWSEAGDLARACGAQPGWWCAVLEGFSSHGAGDHEEALAAFERGFAGMDPEAARAWRDPDLLLDGKARDLFDDAAHGEWDTLLAWFWLLADPLYLMPGNDRKTEHYARWTFSELSDRARNPHGMRWGSDLEELTVRYGWEKGWERHRPSVGLVRRDGGVIGHVLPQSREFVPPGTVLERPWQIEPGAWGPDEHPRSSHVAAYSPDLSAGVGQVAVLHRGDSMRVVAATRLPGASDSPATGSSPPDAGSSNGPEGPLPWAQPVSLAGPDRVGLFLIDPDGRISEARRVGEGVGVLTLSVPAGSYFMSLEAWAPSDGRGGRIRHGIMTDTVPTDLATLSDLMVLDRAAAAQQRLDEAMPFMRPSLGLVAGQEITVAWEIFGLGWRHEDVDFEVSVSRERDGVLGRVGRWLGLADGADGPLRVGWSEPGPSERGPWFRSVDVDIPELEDGVYVLRLEVSMRGREPLVRTRTVEVSSGDAKVAQPQDVRR